MKWRIERISYKEILIRADKPICIFHCGDTVKALSEFPIKNIHVSWKQENKSKVKGEK